MSSYNPFARQGGFIAALCAKSALEYDPALDTRATAETKDPDGEPVPVGDYLTDGSQALTLAFSVGNGKGSTAVELPGDQLDEVCSVLAGWEPVDLDKLSPAECIKRTIGRDSETGEITFKVSLRKNARTVTIPAAEWTGFLDYMERAVESIDDGVANYRNLVREAEVQAAKEAAAKAAKEAAGK